MARPCILSPAWRSASGKDRSRFANLLQVGNPLRVAFRPPFTRCSAMNYAGFETGIPLLPSATKNQLVLERLQVFDEIMFLRITEPKVESFVIAVDDIQQRLEPAIVIEMPFILWEHE